ncbi:hypothetical protein CAI21_07850 [Alkalilimnicola ehrlichii]|uniref:FlgD/Vpr Ig-like domain-containing protein n=1 Tax=Alkalilimnicola ehrlichii TaxID=351052 RepID=A0A3E0WZ39_9GAMM|nr:FlgD immunoglobulin-like domain containing protein [Alkalilimnicola ehrlichii]RFA30105.1 hypothetical protein CAI21_07850 [Alkalilimnicola ehrlichii]RFA37451.1 hypothetical protein CAL65_09195 [Alkalilimnicola ehrlichii]
MDFDLTQAASVELTVSDATTGEVVAQRIYGGFSEGTNTLYWNLQGEAGEFVAPGVYRIGLTAVDANGSRSLTEYTLQRIYY